MSWTPKVSEEPTPYAVHCTGLIGNGDECENGEAIFLTKEEYRRQLSRANQRWRCPKCGAEAWWTALQPSTDE